jgi:hypothetical protein
VREVTMDQWKKIGMYFDMIVEENGKKRRIIDDTGKIILVFDI